MPGCTKCGHKGVTLGHPSYVDSQTGWAPFPGTSHT
jgi:hypothetical protein